MNPGANEFRKNLLWSSGLHFAVIVLLVASMALVPSRKLEPIAWFNPSASVGGTSSSAKPAVQKTVAAPAKAVSAESKAATKPVPKASAQITKSSPPLAANSPKNNVVSKVQEPVGSSGPPSASGRVDPNGWYYALVRDALYRNWQQPTLAQTLVARVTIQVARDGRVLGAQLTTSSGNTAMDESVLESMRQVKQIEPPPPGVPNEIYIDFKLQGLG